MKTFQRALFMESQMTYTAFAQKYKVTLRTVIRWVKDGKVLTIKTPRGNGPIRKRILAPKTLKQASAWKYPKSVVSFFSHLKE